MKLAGAQTQLDQVPLEGRVEVCINEQYGTVCDTDFGREEATVVCGQLGFSRLRKLLPDISILNIILLAN